MSILRPSTVMVVLDFMVLVEQSTSACGAGTELLDSAAGFSLEEDGCSGPGLLLDVTVELLEPVTTLELLLPKGLSKGM